MNRFANFLHMIGVAPQSERITTLSSHAVVNDPNGDRYRSLVQKRKEQREWMTHHGIAEVRADRKLIEPQPETVQPLKHVPEDHLPIG